MESPQAPIKELQQLKINYVVYTKAEDVRQMIDGKWWVHFEGSRESLCFGDHQPFGVGDNIKITFEKVPNAQPL